MRRIKLLFLLIAIISAYTIKAQVAINTDGSSPDASAILDVKSINSGLLLPRMNTIQISGISNPAAGLLVFNIDSTDFYGFNGSKWISIWNIGDTLSDWYCGNIITDSRDEQSYATVQIGTQCWMAENLNIGTRIDGVVEQTENSTIEKYCYDDVTNCDTYGGLYQWNEMMQYETTTPTTNHIQGICPDGWHLPTDDEWKTMEMQLGMSQSQADATGFRGTDEGSKMKSTSGWNNNNGTNSSGFTALPGGYRGTNGSFDSLGNYGDWWSATANGSTSAWYRDLNYSSDRVYRYDYGKGNGFSVRCLRD